MAFLADPDGKVRGWYRAARAPVYDGVTMDSSGTVPIPTYGWGPLVLPGDYDFKYEDPDAHLSSVGAAKLTVRLDSVINTFGP